MIRRLRIRPVVLLLAAALLAACLARGVEPTARTLPALEGTEWVLTSLRGSPPLAEVQINLKFEAERFSGFTGCNYMGGTYAAGADGSLKFPESAVTQIACAEAIMAQERDFLEAFYSAARYLRAEERLELLDASGRAVLVYARRPACAGPPATLAGTAWRLVSVDGEAPGGEGTFLAFVDGSRFVEASRCEAYLSAYQVDGYDLSAPFSAWLGRACPEGEGPAATTLEMPGAYCLAEGRLEIRTVAGRVFAYEPFPQAERPALEGTVWTLLAIVGERQVEGLPVPVPDSTPVRERTAITLALADGTAQGSSGCNTYQAGYTVAGDRLAFGAVGATKKACLDPEGVMEQEQRYLAALGEVTAYRIHGRLLWLTLADGRAWVFAAAEP